MLILRRNQDEELVLVVRGVTVRVKVADVFRGGCRLGIDAPREVDVYRAELLGEHPPPGRVARKAASGDATPETTPGDRT